MTISKRTRMLVILVFIVMGAVTMFVSPQARVQQQQSSFGAVVEEPFAVVLKRDKEAKPRVMAEHQRLIEARYDLSRRVDPNVKMTRGKSIPVGPTARLKGVTWEQLGKMSPDQIKEKGVFPYLPLPHVSHPVGGMIFPQAEVKALPRLERFDMDFDLPEQFLSELPPAEFLI